MNFKSRLIFFFLIFAYCINGLSQVWEKWYGIENIDIYNKDINEFYDKGFLISGRFYNLSTGFSSSIIIKTTINGETLWVKEIEGSNGLIILQIKITNDGGFVLCGGVYIGSHSLPFVAKINSCGIKEWCTAIELYEDVPAAIDVVEDHDGNIGLAVYSSIDGEKTHLYKFNSTGELIWKTKVCTEENYPDSRSPKPESLIVTESNDFLIAGDVYWKNPDDDLYPLRPYYALVDSDGNEKWVKPFGLTEYIYGDATNVLQLSPNYFIGTGSSWLNENKEGLLMSFDSTGNFLDYKIVLPNEINSSYDMLVFMSVQKIDSDYYFHSYAGAEDAGSPVTVIKTNSSLFDNDFEVLGELQLENGRSPISDLLKTHDNKILSASTDRYTYDDYKIYLTKLNTNLEQDSIYTEPYEYDYLCDHPIESGTIYLDDCNIIVGTEEIPSPNEYLEQKQRLLIQLSPNPALEEIKLSFENTENQHQLDLRITSILGQQVYETVLLKGQSEKSLNTQNWEKGIYIVQIYSDKKLVGSARFVKI